MEKNWRPWQIRCLADSQAVIRMRVPDEDTTYYAEFEIYGTNITVDSDYGFNSFGNGGGVGKLIEEDLDMKGSIKWDGCSNNQSDCIHFCGLAGVVRFAKILAEVYQMASELITEFDHDLAGTAQRIEKDTFKAIGK